MDVIMNIVCGFSDILSPVFHQVTCTSLKQNFQKEITFVKKTAFLFKRFLFLTIVSFVF